MHQTLFVIPSWLFQAYGGTPLSLLTIAWIVISLAILVFTYVFGQQSEKRNGISELLGVFPFLVVVGIVSHFVLPGAQVQGINPADPTGPLIPLGVAIQGYGLFLMLGITLGVSLVMWRCRQVGADADRILVLAFWMVVCGIIGARLFYIIQKHDQFTATNPVDFLRQLFDMTNGGLVVYGSLIGGSIGGLIYLTIARLPLLKTADIVAPGMALGLCIGRIGCLMNGCCYGGVCEQPQLPSIRFPAGSSAYVEQLSTGDLIGINAREIQSEGSLPIIVDSVEPGSQAGEFGIEPGSSVGVAYPDPLLIRAVKSKSLEVDADVVIGVSPGPDSNAPAPTDGISRTHRFPISDLPDRSLGTHPTQIYSSINALLLCLVLWFYYPFRKTDGEVFAVMIVLYAVGRFLLELIRIDEAGLFGTPFTISQLVSFGMLAIGLIGLGLLRFGRKNDDGDSAPPLATAAN